MASKIRRVVINTRERATSGDINNLTALQHRALIELGAASLAPDLSRDGVVSGLTASADGSTLNIAVAPGIALKDGTPATSLDSDLDWIELFAAASIDISSLVDPTNPRWVVIEVEPGETDESSSLRDQFDPLTGNFSAVTVTKIKTSNPTFTATAGAAAASPAFPSGTAGRIPLAYIFVPAAAASIATDAVVHCRPLLRSSGSLAQGSDALVSPSANQGAMVQGGGVRIPTAGTTLTFRECFGRLPGQGVSFRVPDGTTLTLAADMVLGGSLPGADDVLYIYAAPAPPFPTGYDASLAPREFIPGTSAAAQIVSAADGAINCIILASTNAPEQHEVQGEIRIGGSANITDPAFGGTASVTQRDLVYLGAIDFDQGTGFAQGQEVRGDVVYPSDRQPGLDLAASGDGTFNLWDVTASVATGGDGLFPDTALEMGLAIDGDVANTNRVVVNVADETIQSKGWSAANNTGSNVNVNQETTVFPSETGNIGLTSDGTWLSGPSIYANWYRDSVLAKR